MFGKILEKIFSNEESSNFNEENRRSVDAYLYYKRKNLFVTRDVDQSLEMEFTLDELEEAINNLKKKSAPGNDGIRNRHLINLSVTGKRHCLKIFNESWKTGKLITDWKTAEVTMINKTIDELSNPNNYRPISLTKCIGKLMEKMIKNKLVFFLNKHKILSDFQSGFREKRNTTDNLFYLSQKALDTFDEGKITCGVVFDIQKAFDKVWHNGLIYKLSKLNLPERLGYWLVNAIENRKFYVKVDSEKSELFNITAGVAQGTILSPILFSIYINDITELNNSTINNNIESLLFADDLFALTINKNLNRAIIRMQTYLNSLEQWFNKWRLQVATHKCSFNIYKKGNIPKNIKEKNLNLKIFNSILKLDQSPTYLGATLDRHLNFNAHADKIRDKCMKSIKILKNLSGKNWSLDEKSKVKIYKCLIRSKMEYAAPVLLTSNYFIKKMQGVQYKALRIIFKEPPGCSSTMLHEKSKLQTVKARMEQLSHNYLKSAISNNNPLIIKLLENSTISSGPYRSPLEIIRNLNFDK